MPKRSTQRSACSADWVGAIALREMLVEELTDKLLVDLGNVQLALAHPAPEMGDATEVTGDGMGCVATLGEMMREGIQVRRQRTR